MTTIEISAIQAQVLLRRSMVMEAEVSNYGVILTLAKGAKLIITPIYEHGGVCYEVLKFELTPDPKR